MQIMFKFYDTCSLLLKAEHLNPNEDYSEMVISSVTLKELEHIKTAQNKDAEIKYAARKVLHELEHHIGEYQVIQYAPPWNKEEANNDMKIINCAHEFLKDNPNCDFKFITNDLSCKHLARLIFGNERVASFEVEDFDYDGYQEVYMDMDEMNNFYMNPNENIYNLNVNEYLIIYDKDTNEIVDKVCWDGETHRRLSYNTFSSRQLGDIKPLKGDIYQALVADSFTNNQITMVKGPAGSGKTLLSLGYLFSKLEKGRIDKIIIFCNTVATKGSARLGFYPGTRDEKLLDSQIGNLLISKLGGRVEVERLINEEKIVLLPLSDIRGYDTSGMRAGVYISEAQNLDIDLMKLTLQRIGEDSICIIDGDCKTQVDDITFSGSRNGMKRVSRIFRNHSVYGEITLKNIHRSKIAKIAEYL